MQAQPAQAQTSFFNATTPAPAQTQAVTPEQPKANLFGQTSGIGGALSGGLLGVPTKPTEDKKEEVKLPEDKKPAAPQGNLFKSATLATTSPATNLFGTVADQSKPGEEKKDAASKPFGLGLTTPAPAAPSNLFPSKTTVPAEEKKVEAAPKIALNITAPATTATGLFGTSTATPQPTLFTKPAETTTKPVQEGEAKSKLPEAAPKATATEEKPKVAPPKL